MSKHRDHLARAVLLALAWCAAAGAQDRIEPLPKDLEQVGIDERLDTTLPLDLEFTDHTGKQVRLRDYFDGKTPVILTLNYFRCQMLCTLQLNELVDTLKLLDWVAGDQFQIVTVSFNPEEGHALAALKRQSYLSYYGKPAAAEGWHFLTSPGNEQNIDALLKATGFRIKYIPETGEYSHAAALILCTPDGRISRYLYAFPYPPKTVRLSLVEASEGKIGSTVDRILLFCYHYDGQGYSLAAMNFVRAGGVLSLVLVGGLLLILWRFDPRRRKTAPVPDP
jgi:protein SCO1/2